KSGIEKWIEDAGDPVLQMRRNNDEAGITQFFKVDPGKQQIDRLRSELEAFRTTEKALTDARIESIAASNQRLFVAMVTLWIVVAIVSLITAWVIARQIVRTLRDVTDTIHDIGEGGDLNKRITIRTRDEIAELGTATNQLLDHVQHENWIKDQIAIASTRFQESDRIESLSSALLTKMNKWFDASYGVVYYDSENEEEGWVKTASFAAHHT
ncbi:HAMP domain-containing protein, partial [Bacillus sp. BB081]